MLSSSVRTSPARNVRVARSVPKPFPRARRSYVPGTILNVSPSGVAGSVSAIAFAPAS